MTPTEAADAVKAWVEHLDEIPNERVAVALDVLFDQAAVGGAGPDRTQLDEPSDLVVADAFEAPFGDHAYVLWNHAKATRDLAPEGDPERLEVRRRLRGEEA